MKGPGKIYLAVFILSCLMLPKIASAAMTSTNYQVLWDSIGVGGDDVSTSASYTLRDSFAHTSSGAASLSATYQESYGYRVGIFDEIVTFSAYAQNRSTQVAATALAGSTVTVTTAADFTVGDFVAVVANEGASQAVGTGKITSIDGTDIVLDALTVGADTPVIDGSSDYVYILESGSAMSLGTLSSSVVATSVIMWDVTADVSQGYGVYLFEDQDLASGATTVSDVADGAVTAGSAEYGARSSDQSLALSAFDTEDSAITTSLAQVASRADNSYETRDFLTIKVAVSSALSAGTYSNTLSLIFVGDY